MQVWMIVTYTALYVGALFLLAWWVDRRVEVFKGPLSSIIYALALTVYCTSWTFYGAVGSAAQRGWEYILIYVGPALVFLFLPGLVRRIGDLTERESISTLSDFLSARYGKSRAVAVIATLAAVTGSLPYIALQLKSVGMSLSAFSPGASETVAGPANETILLTALVMAIFAMLFGTRHSDSTRKNAGLMAVLAFEAVVKIMALALVCGVSIWVLNADGTDVRTNLPAVLSTYTITGRTIAVLLLSTAAILCLPRQFHVAMIERVRPKNVGVARWLFPLYMLVTSAVIVPITVAGLKILPEGSSPDLFVLNIPLLLDNDLLALIVFLGGFSAATGMVVVSTIALSNMVTADLIVPAVMRSGRLSQLEGDSGSRIVTIRRFVIVGLLFLAYLYYRVAGSSEALAQIGLLSFAAAAQFAPALIGGLYWQGGRARGAAAGLAVGLIIWGYTLFIPAVIGEETLGGFLPAFLHPHSIMGYDFGDSLTHGVFWSLLLNIAAYWLVSIRAKERLRDRIQANAFVRRELIVANAGLGEGVPTNVSPEGLRTLASRFLNASAVTHAFDSFETDTGIPTHGTQQADWRLIQRTEKLLTSALGPSSARVVLSSAVGGQNVQLDDVLSILDQQSRAEKFDRHMLQSMLENIPLGVSVVDSEQRLVAWNSYYASLFEYDDDQLQIGTPIVNLIQYNIKRGWIEGDPERQALKRVEAMRIGKYHRFERTHIDGRFLRIQGAPMPGGGYVTLFIDITEDKTRERELKTLTEQLEARVKARTEELENLMLDLEKARADAEGANASKTRFLAAASHDLLQPLNAARLFLGAVSPQSGHDQGLIEKTDRAIKSADDLLRGLLDISKLDHGPVKAKLQIIPLGPLFEDLADEARVMAKKAGLDLRVAPTSLSVRADADFLQSVLRNFLSNARRYTQNGGILLGARRTKNHVRIEVWDTGPGISAEQQDLIFEEFQRFEESDNLGLRGAGLGLAVAKRLSDLMKAPLHVRSKVGNGSVFSITLPRAGYLSKPVRSSLKRDTTTDVSLSGMTVLCVDDEPLILSAMTALLEGWSCKVLTASDFMEAQAALKNNAVDVLIADFQLKNSHTGFDVVEAAIVSGVVEDRIVILSAVAEKLRHSGQTQRELTYINKPVDPAELKAYLMRCKRG